MFACFVRLGSKRYRRMLRKGWCDTGHKRRWCGGEVITVLMVWKGKN